MQNELLPVLREKDGKLRMCAGKGGEAVMIDIKDTISNLELNIGWIEDDPAHQFPGWRNKKMKRITLNIDLEENKELKDGITEAINAYARRVSREYAQREVEAELSRLIEKRLEEYVATKDCAWKIRKAVDDLFAEKVKQNGSVVEMFQESLEKSIGTIKETAEVRVEKIVTKYLDEKFSALLTKFLADAVAENFTKSLQSNKGE